MTAKWAGYYRFIAVHGRAGCLISDPDDIIHGLNGLLAVLGTTRFWFDLLQIIGINILLSGDNAVVIALASRSLPEEQRKWAVIGGSAAAVILRIILCLIIASVLQIPYLRLIGGLLLLYIGV